MKKDLPNYVTKSDFKNVTGVDTSDLASIKTTVDKLDIDKLGKVPSGLNNFKK